MKKLLSRVELKSRLSKFVTLLPVKVRTVRGSSRSVDKLGWLRKDTTKEIAKAIKRKAGYLDSRPATVTVAFMLGLLPIIIPASGGIWSFEVPQSSDILTWVEALWGGTATLFALPVAISTLVMGVALSAESRRTVFKEFRRTTFDAVVILALAYLASSALGISISILDNSGSLFLGRVLVGMLMGEIFVILGIGILVYNAVRFLGNSTEQAVQEQRILEHLYKTVFDRAVHLHSNTLLERWADKNSVFRMNYGHPTGSSVCAPKEAIVEDINLKKLSRWVELLQYQLKDSGTKALVFLSLEKWVGMNQVLAVVSENESSRQDKFLSAIKFRRVSSRHEVPDLARELSLLGDDAIEACKKDAQMELRNVLNTFSAVLSRTILYDRQLSASGLPNLSSDTALTFVWNEPLYRIGKAVASSQSESLLNIWLFFLRSLLRGARDFSHGYSVREVLILLSQYATEVNKPVDLYWLHLKDLELEIDAEIEMDFNSPRAKYAIAQLIMHFSILAPNLLIGLPVGQFANICKWIEKIGADLIGVTTTHEVVHEELEKKQISLIRAKQKMWLLYGAHLIKEYRESKLDETTAIEQFSHVRSQFGELREIWDVFNMVGIEDEIQFRILNGNVGSDQPMFMDSHAGAQWVVALVGLSLCGKNTGGVLKPDRNSLHAFDVSIAPVISEIRREPDRWRPFYENAVTDLEGVCEDMRRSFMISAHNGDLERYNRLAQTQLSPDKVANYVNEIIESTTKFGLHLFETLDENGSVRVVSGTELKELLLVRFQEEPKDYFVDSPDYVEVHHGLMEPPWSVENRNILMPIVNKHMKLNVDSREAALVQLERAILTLKERETPATLVLLNAIDWQFLRMLDEHSQFTKQIDTEHSKIGEFADIPVHQVRFIEKGMIIVMNLANWLHIDSYPDLATHERFFAELREPTDMEIKEWIERSREIVSSGEISFSPEELEVVLKSHLVFKVLEPIQLNQNDPDSCIVIQHQG